MVKKMLYVHMAHDLFDLNVDENSKGKESGDLEEQRITKFTNRVKPMKINTITLLKFLFGIESPEKYQLAHQKIKDSIDLQYILSKLNEIDQLKEIVLTKVIIVPLATTMGQTKSYKKLTQFQPGSNLISFPVLLSVIGQTFVQIAFQCIAFYTLANQSWYVTALEYHSAKGDQENYLNMQICFETTVIFIFIIESKNTLYRLYLQKMIRWHKNKQLLKSHL